MKDSRRLIRCMVLVGGIVCSSPPVASAELDFHGSLGEGAFSTYVPAISSPLQNETPYITTELRPIYWFHKIPEDSLVGAGDIHLVAAQLRVALTERLGLIATKDGYAWISTERALEDEDGFANLAAGLKYALLSRPQEEAIVTAGFTVEVPTGDLNLSGVRFQGGGNGMLNPFLTGAKRFGRFGFQASTGLNIPFDANEHSLLFHYHAHADYELLKGLFAVLEYNGYSVLNHGRERQLNFEGVDVFNLGNTGGGTVQTIAAGGRYRLTEHWQIGTAGEWHISSRSDLFDWRYQVDLIWTF